MYNMPTAHFSGNAESFLGRGAHATAHIFFDATWEQVVGEQVRLLDAYMLRHTCYTIHATPYMLLHATRYMRCTRIFTHMLHRQAPKQRERERERERKGSQRCTRDRQIDRQVTDIKTDRW